MQSRGSPGAAASRVSERTRKETAGAPRVLPAAWSAFLRRLHFPSVWTLQAGVLGRPARRATSLVRKLAQLSGPVLRRNSFPGPGSLRPHHYCDSKVPRKETEAQRGSQVAPGHPTSKEFMFELDMGR